MNMSKSRDIQAKMPSPKVIYASNESKSVLARNLEECRDNDKNSQSVFLSFKCILARNCEGTEQLQIIKDTVSVFLLLFDQCGNFSESRMHGCFHQFKENCFVAGNNGAGLRHPADSSLKIRGFSGRDAVCNQKNLVTQM